MKTSELTLTQLSYLVSMIEMPHLVWGETIGIHHASNQIVVAEIPEPQCYSPFSDWDMCGSIIEREKIRWNEHERDGIYAWIGGTHHDPLHIPMLADNPIPFPTAFEWGKSILIAAMRTYVASKLGDEVNLPEGLE